MDEYEKKDFAKLLKHGALEAHRWMNNTDSTAVRIYDRNLQAFPLTIDFYGQYVLVVDYSDGGMEGDDRIAAEDIISRYVYVEQSRIVWRSRKKREGREQHEKADESLRLDVKENGFSFEVELRSYADTGLFLDQAITRSEVMGISQGMRVLNLFSYTGSFSVYAAAGGAESVVSVDLSNVYSAWAKRNLEKNGFIDERKYSVVTCDAAQYLREAEERSERYDIVIFDPPAFSNSHKAEDFDVQKDHLGFLAAISRLLALGGVVVFSENLKGFDLEKAVLKPFWKVSEITDVVHAQGFSSKRSGLRVWMLKKVADMKAMDYASAGKKRRRMDEEKAERLSFDEAAEAQDKAPVEKTEARDDERSPRRSYGRREGSGERRGRDRGYSRRDGGRYAGSREGGYRDRDRDYGYDRPRRRYEDDFRPRDRERFSDRDRGYDRPRYRDDYRDDYRDRDRDRYYSDRPRYRSSDYDRRDSRPYGEKESYRQRESWPGRRDDRDRGYGRDRRERSWDNETGRFYRGERSDRRFDRREPRYSETGEDRRPFGDAPKRRRNAPKPYGYDSFMVTKNRDTANVGWLKDTEIRSDRNEDNE